MFYEMELKTHVRIPPTSFKENIDKAVFTRLNEQFNGFVSRDFGIVIAVDEICTIGDGIIIPGDGAAYYETTFKAMVFNPEIQEVVLGKVTDITDFGAFLEVGPVDGMIHVSQTMDDFVSFSKSNVLAGKESKKVLKVGDICRARIIAVSYKDIHNPKIGLTMRQTALGSLKWLDDDIKKKEKKQQPPEVKKKK